MARNEFIEYLYGELQYMNYVYKYDDLSSVENITTISFNDNEYVFKHKIINNKLFFDFEKLSNNLSLNKKAGQYKLLNKINNIIEFNSIEDLIMQFEKKINIGQTLFDFRN